MMQCITDAQKVGTDVTTAVNDLKKQDMAGAKAALMQALTDADAAVGDCCPSSFEEEIVADSTQCMTDLKGIVADAEAAVQDFEKKTVSGMTDGIKQACDAFKLAKKAKADCMHKDEPLKGIGSLFSCINDQTKIIADLKTVADDLIKDKDLTKAMADLQAGFPDVQKGQ